MSTDELLSEGAVTVGDAVKFSGIGRTRLYQMMDAGKLAYSQVGGRRLIPKRALRQLLAESLRGAVSAPGGQLGA